MQVKPHLTHTFNVTRRQNATTNKLPVSFKHQIPARLLCHCKSVGGGIRGERSKRFSQKRRRTKEEEEEGVGRRRKPRSWTMSVPYSLSPPTCPQTEYRSGTWQFTAAAIGKGFKRELVKAGSLNEAVLLGKTNSCSSLFPRWSPSFLPFLWIHAILPSF